MHLDVLYFSSIWKKKFIYNIVRIHAFPSLNLPGLNFSIGTPLFDPLNNSLLVSRDVRNQHMNIGHDDNFFLTSGQSWLPFLKAEFQLFLMVLIFQLEDHYFNLWIYSCIFFTALYIFLKRSWIKSRKNYTFFKSWFRNNP